MAIPSRPPSSRQESNAGYSANSCLQAFDVVVVNDASSLRDRPFEPLAEPLAHLSREVLPAGVAVLPRDHELRVALRQRQIDIG